MNKDTINRTIAEACGLNFLYPLKRRNRSGKDDPNGVVLWYCVEAFGGSQIWAKVPAYTDCLNACHEMEKSIEDRMSEYLYMLVNVVKGRDLKTFRFSDRMLTESYFRELVRATASQRCEAFLRTLNLWTPTGEENE